MIWFKKKKEEILDAPTDTVTTVSEVKQGLLTDAYQNFSDKDALDPALQILPAADLTKQYNLLLIEDDLFISELYKKQLTLSGFHVDIAMGGGEGTAKLKGINYDLLLLDIMLPGTSGLDILRSVKQDKALSALPVIVISNLEQDEIVEESFSLGAAKFLIKSSITPAELVSSVQEVLHIKQN